jgi:hypothetical protein
VCAAAFTGLTTCQRLAAVQDPSKQLHYIHWAGYMLMIHWVSFELLLQQQQLHRYPKSRLL